MTNRLADLEQYLQQTMASWSSPGLAVALVRGEDVLHQAAYGLRDVANNLPTTIDTRFAMASCTKSFAAMSVALLVDDGKLEWDTPVRDYIPEFILDDDYVTKHITVRDMLSHRTGMPRHDLAVWRLDISRREFIKRMKHYQFSASFREKFQYNNLMYYSIAYLVDVVSGQPWEDFVQSRIFDPLGMTASNFFPDAPHPDQHTSLGYRPDFDENGKVKDWVKMDYGRHTAVSPGAAGALFSTLADLTQWLKVQVNGGKVGDLQLVRPDTLKQMHKPHTIIPVDGIGEALHGNTIATYGLGWFVEPHRGYTLVHHGGNVEGFSLVIGFVPQASIGIVVLTNLASNPLRDVLLYELADRALDLPDGNWNAKYHGLFDPMFAGMQRSKQTTAAEKVAGAPHTHPLEDYVGVYAADGYPDFAVQMIEDGTLEVCSVGSLDWEPLRHQHYDIFEADVTVFDAQVKVPFLTNLEGEIYAISLGIEPAVEDVIFKRKPVTIPADVIAALVDVPYVTEIPGLAFTVSHLAEKFYITQTGGTPTEIKPYRLTEEEVAFVEDRTRFAFRRDGATIPHLTLKAEGMTLEATRTEP